MCAARPPTTTHSRRATSWTCWLYLVRKSLILAEGEDAAVRYWLLETLREYAWEKLRAADEEVATRRRHRDWYTSWAEHWWIELARAQRDHSAAHAAYAVSLAVARGAGVGIEAGWTLMRCAGLCFERGAFERAARLFGAADAWQEGTAATTLPGIFGRADRAHVAHDLTATRAALGEAGFAAAFADGQAMTLAQALAYAVADPPPPGSPPQAASGRTRSKDLLTPREREVARLIAAGSSNRLIADELVIAEATVERHVANIFAKLDVHSRAQVAAWIAAQPDGVARH